MPSPFSGMDAYREQTDWASVHVHLAVEIARNLAPLLKAKYCVRAEKVYVLSGSLEGGGVARRKPEINCFN